MNRLGSMIAAMLLLCGAADASQPGEATLKNWKGMDLCAKEAQTAFPDYTAAANVQRDARLKACLAAHNLPSRDPLSATQPGH